MYNGQNELYIAVGDGNFIRDTESILATAWPLTAAVVVADFKRDGWNDVSVDAVST